MSETVFIFGAGASKQAGAPVMRRFLDAARELRKDGRSAKIQADSDLVFKGIDALQRVHSKAKMDLINLESVFAAFEMAKLLGRLVDTPAAEVARLPTAMRRVIQNTLEKLILFPKSSPEGQIRPPEPYNALLRMLTGYAAAARGEYSKKVSFLTFNYDLCLDFAL